MDRMKPRSQANRPRSSCSLQRGAVKHREIGALRPKRRDAPKKARIPFLEVVSSSALVLSLIVSGLAARFSLVGLCNAAALLTGPFGVILLLLLAATLLGRILSLLRVLTLSHNHL